ncbi:hypothetical protein CBR_g22954 [Chara braunii]|uniref:ubiquitinyl hydrolase 1 n=1 Tax=Chara braunii TaxID=69332 RepID=A0A388L360_CHABU|nr:hypothetical protein CBR_g22954 [Chara braunii]|eukprot:GBG76736.1 hypothetical protein CBR_g22954 [Chara braunii]
MNHLSDSVCSFDRSPSQEKEELEKLLDESNYRRKEGDTYYVISAEWWQQWMEYVGSKDSKKTKISYFNGKPGVIDNNKIAQGGENKSNFAHLKRGLEEQVDFCLVPEAVWDRLVRWYSGGPALPRKVIAQGEESCRQLIVELHPLRVQIVRSQSGICEELIISRKATVGELKQRVADLLNMEGKSFCLWDFFNEKKQKKLTDAVRTLEDYEIQDLQKVLVESEGRCRGGDAEQDSFASTSSSSPSPGASLSSAITSSSSLSTGAALISEGSASTYVSHRLTSASVTASRMAMTSDIVEDDVLGETAREGDLRGEGQESRRAAGLTSAHDSQTSSSAALAEQKQLGISAQSSSLPSSYSNGSILPATRSGSLSSPPSNGLLSPQRQDQANNSLNRSQPTSADNIAPSSSSSSGLDLGASSRSKVGAGGGDAVETRALAAIGNNNGTGSGVSTSGGGFFRTGVMARLGWRDGGGGGGGSAGGRGGLTGLQNLGNTCFMNSALQCLAHTPQLVEYFLSDYVREINLENPLGMRGEIARAFGELLREMILVGKSPVAPRHFKGTLARFAPQFSGYNQHDSQELLAFLLNGLHEDLNRVRDKPYIEQKDADGRPDEKVAIEAWANHKARNDSIVVDICQGQYKSTLVCPTCGKTSVTFDPFMYLSLPLPAKTSRSMMVAVLSADGSVDPDTYTVSVPKQGTVEDLLEAVAKACDLDRETERMALVQLQQGRILRPLDFMLQESIGTIKDEEPLVAYRVPCSVPRSRLVMILNRREEGMYKGDWRMFGVPLLGIAPEGGVTSAKEVVQVVKAALRPMQRRRGDLENGFGAGGAAEESRRMPGRKKQVQEREEEDGRRPSVNGKRGGPSPGDSMRVGGAAANGDAVPSTSVDFESAETNGTDGTTDISMEDGEDGVQVDGPTAGGNEGSSAERRQQDCDDGEKRWTSKGLGGGGGKGGKGGGRVDMENDGDYDNGDVMSEVSGVVPGAEVEMTEVVADKGMAMVRREDANDDGEVEEREEEEDSSGEEDECPFLVSCMDDRGLHREGVVELDKPLPRNWVVRSCGWRCVALEWASPPPTGREEYDLQVLELISERLRVGGPSLAKRARQESLSLYSCLEAFLSKESLGKDDMWYCPRCKEHRQATKKLDLWRMPDILVVHLKRFSFSHWWKRKLETFVDFPIRGLDVRQYVTRKRRRNGGTKQRGEKSSCLYDLYAVSNHYGGMGGGHYTAYAKLVNDDLWYNFDDSYVSPMREEDVKSPAAYMLFYKRVGKDDASDAEGDDVDVDIDDAVGEAGEEEEVDDVASLEGEGEGREASGLDSEELEEERGERVITPPPDEDGTDSSPERITAIANEEDVEEGNSGEMDTTVAVFPLSNGKG